MRRSPFVENALLLAIAFVTVQLMLLPLAPGDGIVMPDLVYALVVAWVIRRPASTPLWVVLVIGLYADMMLARPVGLGALALLLAAEGFRARSVLFHGAPFPLEWLAAAAGFAAMLVGMRLALELVFTDAPGIAVMVRALVATALAYPVVALGLSWCVELRMPRGSGSGRGFGRLS